MIPQLDLNFQSEICSSSSCMNCTSSSAVILDLFPDQAHVDSKPSPVQSLVEDFPLGRFMRFLKHIKLKELLSRITDPRDPKKTKHRIEIILSGFYQYFFSM